MAYQTQPNSRLILPRPESPLYNGDSMQELEDALFGGVLLRSPTKSPHAPADGEPSKRGFDARPPPSPRSKAACVCRQEVSKCVYLGAVA